MTTPVILLAVIVAFTLVGVGRSKAAKARKAKLTHAPHGFQALAQESERRLRW